MKRLVDGTTLAALEAAAQLSDVAFLVLKKERRSNGKRFNGIARYGIFSRVKSMLTSEKYAGGKD